MRRIVFVTQQLDPDHPNLGSTVPQVAALARKVDEVVVVADRIVPEALPPNARAYSFHSRTKPGRGARVLAAVARELPGLRNGGAVIAHMCPVYALTVAPIVRPAGVPLVLWWSHWKVDSVVRAAERVCTAVVSVEPRTFAIDTPKLVSVGQAIDVDRFPLRTPHVSDADEPLRVAVIGRYSPAKGVGTILRAARIALDAGLDVQVDVRGPATTEEARGEREALGRLVDELGLGGRVTLGGPVTRAEVAELLAAAEVLVNNAPGGADRIVYEAAATGLPVLASNRAHEDLLGTYAFFERDDAEGLADRLAAVAALTVAQQAELGRRLRRRVEEGHSVESWSTGILRAAGIEAGPA